MVRALVDLSTLDLSADVMAEEEIRALDAEGCFPGQKIATQIEPAGTFWPASSTAFVFP